MPEILKKKSPAKRLYWNDFAEKWVSTLVSILIVVLPVASDAVSDLLDHPDIRYTILGGVCFALLAFAKRFVRDNQKE